jgi:short-subunit dehydrogenase involved in D-alanine esterification of teichoic acids
MKISENTILITGAASGIGLEIARLFSQHNNKIIFRNIIKRPAIHSA